MSGYLSQHFCQKTNLIGCLKCGSYSCSQCRQENWEINMKPPAPFPFHEMQAEAATSEPNHLPLAPARDAYPENDDAWLLSKPFVPPTKPPIDVRVMDRESALKILPRFDELQLELALAAESADYSPEHSALFVEQADIGENIAYSSGPVLIANVPTYLAPLLAQLAGTEPELVNWSTLDLRDAATLLLWSVRDKHGLLHTVALDAGILTKLPIPTAEHDGLSFAPIIFCCADQVAFSGFWVDESDISEAQAAGMSGMRYWQYSDYEQAIANAKDYAAGSPRPWFNNPWRDDDQSVMTQLPICGYGEVFPPTREDDDKEIEDYVPPSLPATDAHFVERGKASDVLPEFDAHQMRLTAACVVSRTNQDTSSSIDDPILKY